jgi:hypothetical protein
VSDWAPRETILIPNRRPDCGWGLLVLLCILLCWGGFCAAFWFWPPTRYPLIIPGLLVPLLIASVIILVWSLTRQQLNAFCLGAGLEARPGRTYSARYVRRIRFDADPEEDYHDTEVSSPLCEVSVEFRIEPRLRMIVTVEDASRLRVWAVSHHIDVLDPAGHSRAPTHTR